MRHPPFRAAPTLRVNDATSRDGAERLAAHIAAVWLECGHRITPVVEPLPSGLGWSIHLPQLVNGLPATVALSSRKNEA